MLTEQANKKHPHAYYTAVYATVKLQKIQAEKG